MRRTKYLAIFSLTVTFELSSVGCDSTGEATVSVPTSASQFRDRPDASTIQIVPSDLRRRLRANERAKFTLAGNTIVRAELYQSGIRSIEPLRGLPLRFLDLGMTDVSDLSPVAGMPLQELILESTPVSDIRVLEGMRLEVLKLQHTQVTDLSVLRGMPLRQLNLLGLPIADLQEFSGMPLTSLWVPMTRISSLQPLSGMKLVSLDIQQTAVADLQPLSDITTLKRLNVADTEVTDLRPLRHLQLERLILTPERITAGFEVIRSMSSLVQIQPEVETEMSAQEFWKRYDLGVWSPAPATGDPAPATGDTAPATGSAAGGD